MWEDTGDFPMSLPHTPKFSVVEDFCHLENGILSQFVVREKELLKRGIGMALRTFTLFLKEFLGVTPTH